MTRFAASHHGRPEIARPKTAETGVRWRGQAAAPAARGTAPLSVGARYRSSAAPAAGRGRTHVKCGESGMGYRGKRPKQGFKTPPETKLRV